MSNLKAPEIGEWMAAEVPAVRKFAHITVGPATTNDLVVGDTAVYTLLSVGAPIVVFNIWTQVEVAFTTNVTMTIGDSDSAARFTTDTTMNIAATGAVLIAGGVLSVPYVYAAAQDLLIDLNGATVAAGKLNVYIDYAVLSD